MSKTELPPRKFKTSYFPQFFIEPIEKFIKRHKNVFKTAERVTAKLKKHPLQLLLSLT